MNEKKNYTKEDAYHTLSEINGWIGHADAKASILMGFLALLIGLTTTVFQSIDFMKNASTPSAIVLSVFMGIVLFMYISLAASSVLFCIMTLIARRDIKKLISEQKLPKQSIFFYGHIQKYGYEKFVQATSEMSEDDILKDLQVQIVTNSYIAEKKFKNFNKAIILSGILFCVTMLLLLLLQLI